MAISAKNTKILWANAAGLCSFEECRLKLCTDDASNATPFIIGEMAHIKGELENSNRHDPQQSEVDRNDYLNLILLCPNHHTLIDKKENEEKYNADYLAKMKATHEEFVRNRLKVINFSDKQQLAKYIFPLLKENHAVFKSFGPHSDIARKNPQSDAHKVWLFERLSRITPNNRAMLRVCESNIELFSPEELIIVTRFFTHVRSYDRWVHEEISYEGVVRFPLEFDKLISEIANAA